MNIEPKVGMRIYGYCNGLFGRDSYEAKIIEFVAYDYIVARNEYGEPEFLKSEDNFPLVIPEEWTREDNE